MEVVSRKTTNDELCDLSGRELAKKICRGEVSALEAVEAHIERIEAVNPLLNAVVVKRYDEARAEARELDQRRSAGQPLGPLSGVPITVKESLDVAGTPSTFGIPSRKSILAQSDDEYVARLRAAGAIVLGKTNVSQLLLFLETDNPLYGRSNHPLREDRSPGGSSGGQAAIIAAGGSALGLGTDIGGSIRVPATFCGIAAIKPTAGRMDDAGLGSVSPGQRAILSQVGVLARDVGDVALALSTANGDIPLGDPATVDVGKLRVGFYTDDRTIAPAPAVQRAVREAADTLRACGAEVVEWTPPDVAYAMDLFVGILSADRFAGCQRALGANPRDRRIAKIEQIAARSRPLVRAMNALIGLTGRRGLQQIVRNYGFSDTDHFWRLCEAQLAYQRRFAAALATHRLDVILAPACALPAWRHGATEELVVAGGYTVLYNLLGFPTGVVPFTKVRPDEESARPLSNDPMERTARATEEGSAGLPVGVQVIARPWREHVVLSTMTALESAGSATRIPSSRS
jgi:fatty acid amide hydrolase